MNREETWRNARNSRSLRYAGRVLDPARDVLLRSGPVQAARFDGQVSIITAANLLCRMTPSVALDIPQVPIVSSLPWAGNDLRQFVLDLMFKADPFGNFEHRTAREGDYVIELGRAGAPVIAHGSGWNVYLGPKPSPIPASESLNPIGPALSAILSATAAFNSDLNGVPERVLLNALDWRACEAAPEAPEFTNECDLGDVWVAGTGSVGTAVLYFLTLATRRFSTALLDMDVVKVHNLDRSPIFNDGDVKKAKVEVTAAWLRDAGISNVRCDPNALDESALWHGRQAGTPDVLVAAANERNVRSVIEAGFPPVQIYGTTGKNWQAALIRHVPMKDPCSSCLFPEHDFAPTQCATGTVSASDDEVMDAALPFLSFAAGAMAAAELLKLGLPGYPFSANRVVLNTQPAIRAVGAGLVRRTGCICHRRSNSVHQQMIAGSRFAGLS